MLYCLEQGRVERTIIRQCLIERRQLPARIRNAPQLYPGLELYFDAFMELHTCRGGMGCDGPIPWTAVDRYCERHGLTGERYEDMLYFVRAVDDAWLKHRADSAESESKRRGKAVRKSGK